MGDKGCAGLRDHGGAGQRAGISMRLRARLHQAAVDLPVLGSGGQGAVRNAYCLAAFPPCLPLLPGPILHGDSACWVWPKTP